ncbi:AGE family epimerase/isomerase [bacterium]|nr:AGE family epimerase/isomerase [bacterium]
MLRTILFFMFLLLVAAVPLHAQYQVSSPYLVDPDLAIGYVDSCATFWLIAFDQQQGGFHTNVDRDGTVLSNWGTEKNMISQSRDAYGFVRAFMMTGDELYLEMADSALAFQYRTAWDSEYGGWFNGVSDAGTPTNPNDQKTAFYQHYALLGPVAMYEATRRPAHLEWVETGYNWMEEHLWDDRDGINGYFDLVNRDTTNPQKKSFNATVDAVTTHLLYLYLMTGDEVYRERLQEMAVEMRIRLVDSMPFQEIGFAEHFFSNWSVNSSETMTIMGHVLKTGWCLARINQLLPNAGYVSDAQVLVDEVYEKGYDHVYGGPFKDYNRTTGEMLLWGLQDSAKAWWQMEQAVVAGLQLWDTTGEDRYLQMADSTLDFFMEHFVDHEYGDVYSDRTRDGGQAWGLEKGSNGKAAYHSIETGYYTYLYGNLFVHGRNVTLYYKFDSAQDDASYTLSPLAWRPEAYRIASVLLDGEDYLDFDGTDRLLNLPSGVGGLFAVEFEPIGLNGVNDDMVVTLPGSMNLLPAYPNPFNGTTTVRYQLDQPMFIDLRVVNMLGQEVAWLSRGKQTSGVHEVSFTSEMLASGTYFVLLKGETEIDRTRLILLK